MYIKLVLPNEYNEGIDYRENIDLWHFYNPSQHWIWQKNLKTSWYSLLLNLLISRFAFPIHHYYSSDETYKGGDQHWAKCLNPIRSTLAQTMMYLVLLWHCNFTHEYWNKFYPFISHISNSTNVGGKTAIKKELDVRNAIHLSKRIFSVTLLNLLFLG